MTGTATTLILVRHGQTDWNVERRIQGASDIALNDLGQWQARQLGKRLVDFEFSHVLCSDALRARQTLAPFLALRPADVRYEACLRERRYGIFEGHTVDALAERDARQAKLLAERVPDFAPDGGESLHEVYQRAVTVIESVLQPGACVLVVTHGGVLDCLYRYFCGEPLTTPRTVEMRNAALNVVTWQDERFVIQAWADSAHLSPMP